MTIGQILNCRGPCKYTEIIEIYLEGFLKVGPIYLDTKQLRKVLKTNCHLVGDVWLGCLDSQKISKKEQTFNKQDCIFDSNSCIDTRELKIPPNCRSRLYQSPSIFKASKCSELQGLLFLEKYQKYWKLQTLFTKIAAFYRGCVTHGSIKQIEFNAYVSLKSPKIQYQSKINVILLKKIRFCQDM